MTAAVAMLSRGQACRCSPRLTQLGSTVARLVRRFPRSHILLTFARNRRKCPGSHPIQRALHLTSVRDGTNGLPAQVPIELLDFCRGVKAKVEKERRQALAGMWSTGHVQQSSLRRQTFARFDLSFWLAVDDHCTCHYLTARGTHRLSSSETSEKRVRPIGSHHRVLYVCKRQSHLMRRYPSFTHRSIPRLSALHGVA